MQADTQQYAENRTRSDRNDQYTHHETRETPRSNTKPDIELELFLLSSASEEVASMFAQRANAVREAEPQLAICLMRDHIEKALIQLHGCIERVDRSQLTHFSGTEDCETLAILHGFPEYMRSRLDPVFSRPELFDSKQRHQQSFDRWEREYNLTHKTIASQVNGTADTVPGHIKNLSGTLEQLCPELEQIICDMRDGLEPKYGLDPE